MNSSELRKGIKKGQVKIVPGTAFWKIIGVLALSGPLNVERIHVKTHLDYAFCHKRVRILQNIQFIEESKRQPGPKGRDLAFYDLTLQGVIVYLTFSKFEKIDNVAIRYARLLPFIFGEWEYFRKSAAKDIVLNNLRNAVEQVHERIAYGYWNHQTFSDQKKIGEIKEILERETFIPWIVPLKFGDWLPDAYSVELTKAIKHNQRIWDHLKPEISQIKKDLTEALSHLDEVLEEK